MGKLKGSKFSDRCEDMGRRPILMALLGFLLATVTCVSGVAKAEETVRFATSSLVIKSTSGAHRFKIEVAENDIQRARGLMFRRSLEPDHGMLFDFKRDIYISMWMRNTFIPLDMLFLDKSGRVTFIRENATPGSLDTIQPPDRNRAVLELRGGTVARLGIATGDQVEHKIFR